MIRHPLGLRLDADRSVRDQIYEAARIGARGAVIDASGDIAPHRLGETGRRELRQILRTAELSLVALSLPTRRPFDSTDQLDDRMRLADAAFGMAYELGTTVGSARQRLHRAKKRLRKALGLDENTEDHPNLWPKKPSGGITDRRKTPIIGMTPDSPSPLTMAPATISAVATCFLQEDDQEPTPIW